MGHGKATDPHLQLPGGSRSSRQHDVRCRLRRDRGRVVDTFWTLAAFGFVFGVGGLVGFIFWYWFFVIPDRALRERARAPDERRTQ